MSTTPSTTGATDSPVTTATAAPLNRKRPLRTYSRRSVQTREPDPEPTTEEDTRQASGSPTPCAEASINPPSLPSQGQAPKPKRGSILAYFKPLPPSSDNDATSVRPSSDPAEPPSTPPSSPPSQSNSRKRRRLTTRPQFFDGTQHLKDDTGSKDGDGHDTRADDDSIGYAREGSAESTIIVRTDTPEPMRPALSDVAVNILPQPTETASAMADQGTRSKRPREKRQTKDMTQTTLSLSVHKEPGFTICSVCDILYNPLNEKDRKEHKRRHAAHTRNKARPV